MRKGTIAMRSIFLSFLLAFVASAPSRAAEQPSAYIETTAIRRRPLNHLFSICYKIDISEKVP